MHSQHMRIFKNYTPSLGFRVSFLAVLFAAAAWGTGSPARAAVIEVTPANVEGNIADDDTTTRNLQEIIDDSGTESGDVIQFASGTYSDVGELLVTKPLTFRKDPEASGDAVFTGKFMLHIRSKDVKVEDLTFREVTFPDRITSYKGGHKGRSLGDGTIELYFSGVNVSRFLLARKAANADSDATNDDQVSGLDYTGYRGGIARADLEPFIHDDGNPNTNDLDWLKYNPHPVLSNKDGFIIDSVGNKLNQVAGGKWNFPGFDIRNYYWYKTNYGVIAVNSDYYGRGDCPEGEEVTGIEITRNVFDGTEMRAIHVYPWSTCEEEVSIVGNVFDDIGVVPSEFLRTSSGNFLTDGDGYRISAQQADQYAIGLHDVKTAVVSDNIIRATTHHQISVRNVPEGGRVTIRNNRLESATTPGARSWGQQIEIRGAMNNQPDDVKITIMNNQITGSHIPFSTYAFTDFIAGVRANWLCGLYPDLNTMTPAQVEALLEPRIWRSYVPGFPFPEADGADGASLPMPPDAPPASLTSVIKKTVTGGDPYGTPLNSNIVIGNYDIVRFKNCSRTARIAIEHQKGVSIVDNDLGYVASSPATGSGQFRNAVADSHNGGGESDGPGYMRFGVSLWGDAAKLVAFTGNNIEYSSIRAVDVFDTQESVSAAGNYLGARGYVSRGVSTEGTLGAPTGRDAEERGPRQEMTTRPTAFTLTGASVDGATLTLTFSGALDDSVELSASAFSVTAPDSGRRGARTEIAVRSATVSGATVVLTLAEAVSAGTADIRVTYEKPASGGVTREADGESAAGFENRTVTNATTAPPAPIPATGGGGDGGCALASAGGTGAAAAVAVALLPLLFSLRRSGAR